MAKENYVTKKGRKIRAKNSKGQFVGDNPETPENEAYILADDFEKGLVEDISATKKYIGIGIAVALILLLIFAA